MGYRSTSTSRPIPISSLRSDASTSSSGAPRNLQEPQPRSARATAGGWSNRLDKREVYIEPGRLFDREVPTAGYPSGSVHIASRASGQVGHADAVRHEPAAPKDS